MSKKKTEETIDTQETKEWQEPQVQEVATEAHPEAKEEPEQEPQHEPEKEQVQFRVRIKDNKVALRTSPEFRIDSSNLLGIASQEGMKEFDIVEVKNGYGRTVYPKDAWISLDACVKC